MTVEPQSRHGGIARMTPRPSGSGVPGSGRSVGRQAVTASEVSPDLATQRLMEVIAERSNLNLAYGRVKANGGAPGVDGMTVDDLKTWCRAHSAELIGHLLEGSYQPHAVRGVKIPKPGGGERQLGIPTVVDRLVQQAISQVLTPLIDPTFSDHSYGFRPGRSAHQAVRAGAAYVAEGRRIVVDIDLEKFFDRVNHDILMARLARHVTDPRLLRIVRRFLEAGLMTEGVCVRRDEGTPQGGPLSPLLANLLLDDLDQELERRGHRFCRYADDCNIYVQSQAAGERVLASVTAFPRRDAQTAGQPCEKRGGAGPRTKVPRLPAAGRRSSGPRAQFRRPDEGPPPSSDPAQPGQGVGGGHRGGQPLHRRLAGILPPRGMP